MKQMFQIFFHFGSVSDIFPMKKKQNPIIAGKVAGVFICPLQTAASTNTSLIFRSLEFHHYLYPH